MDELTEKIGAAFAQGYRHLVGGGLGAQRIRELGGEGIILEPSAASFRQPITERVRWYVTEQGKIAYAGL